VNARGAALLLAMLAAIAAWQLAHRPRQHPAGVLVAETPQQTDIDATVALPNKGEFAFTPLARFSISARVLGCAGYRWDTEAKLAPTDLALGWGRMSDSAVLGQIDITQSGRFYHWQVREFPIPEGEIIGSSANMHLIAADTLIERAIEQTRVGDVVSFDGFLVRADGPNGYHWISSLTRSDSGGGACELVWVEHFTIAPPR